MSLAFEKLNPVLVRDPRTIINTQNDYAVLKSGSQTTWKAWTSTSIATSSIQFSCPPPSGGVFVASKVYFYLPVKLTITGTAAIGSHLLDPGAFALRSYPIMGSIDTLTSTINNQSVSINIADIIHAISWFNTDEELLNGDYSTFPGYADQSQQYDDLIGANRNPLGGYSDGIDGSIMQRGAFPINIISNQVSVNPATPITAVIEFGVCEPIMLPPYYFGSGERQAFFNVNSMDFNITFVGQVGNRMLSIAQDVAGANRSITSIVPVFGGMSSGPSSTLQGGNLPLMLIQYITPQETQVISSLQNLVYPYFDVQRYPTQQSPILAGTSNVPMGSNNIQLSSIPRRLYIYVRDSNSSLYASPLLTDTFFRIDSVSIQFMNQNGLLASASTQQLFLMTRGNHSKMNWVQYSGGPSNSAGLAPTISTVGSVLCIEFATNIGLASNLAPGTIGQYQLQVEVRASNISNRTIAPTMYLVPVLEGVFEINGLGRASISIGVLKPEDVDAAQNRPGVSYADVEDVKGGNFFSGIKQFFTNKVLPQLKSFVANRGISKGLAFIPHPAAQAASKAAHLLGYGEDDGGVMAAGVMAAGEGVMHRRQMKNRIKHY